MPISSPSSLETSTIACPAVVSRLTSSYTSSFAPTSVYGFVHPLYYANVIDTLRGEAHAEVDGYEGLRSLEVIIAAYRSARDGVRVGLPLVF